MQSDTFFSATIVTALVAVGAAAATTLGSPAGAAAVQRQAVVARSTLPSATLPAVTVIGKRDTRIARDEAATAPTRVQ